MKFNLKAFVGDLKSGWSVPPKGRYVSYKEVAAYSIGGMGVNFIAAMVGQIVMAASCLLIGSVYKINPTDLATITLISTILSLAITPLRGMLIDNTKSKKGKFRPLILWTGLPTIIITIAMAFIPLSASYATKTALIGVGFCILSLIYNQFFYLGYANLVQVITPNSNERAGIISVSSIVYSMAPTLTGFLFPLIAQMLDTDMTNIVVYRVAFPVFCILGYAISFLAYFGTKERIVVPKRYVAKVNFWHGIKSVCSNKYFWIANISSWFAFARNAASGLMTWIFVYQIQDNVIMALLTTVMGTASLIGMVVAPILIRFIGKRNLIIGSNVVFAIAFGLIFIFPSNAVAILILTYIGFIANSTSIISLPAVNADILDYQQWKTGERLEGFSANIGIVGSLIGMGTAYIIPYVNEAYGLIQNYDILYDQAMTVPLYKSLALISLAGGILTLLPFIFYNLSEKKHKEIIEDLKQRAIEANLEDGITESLDELDKELATNQEAEAIAKKKELHDLEAFKKEAKLIAEAKITNNENTSAIKTTDNDGGNE